MKIQQQRPLLATAEKILPYLMLIDKERYYSNRGHLVLELEKRLGEMFGCQAEAVSSCTSGLTACLLALDLPRGSLVACPSWTFVATAAAIVAAGHVPYFCDVDEKMWLLNPDFPADISAMVVVGSFGVPAFPSMWDVISEKRGISVIIDAAAGFDSVKNVGRCPVVISSHATKVMSTGEGGFILSQDKEFLKRVRTISNFGLNPEREAIYPGINGKMSEYAAAVGHAELDYWDDKRQRWLDVKHAYMDEFRKLVMDTPIMDVRWASNVFPIRLSGSAASVIGAMAAKDIPCRAWKPVHQFKAYSDAPRTDMPVTDALADSVMLLPFSIDQKRDEIEYMSKTLRECL